MNIIAINTGRVEINVYKFNNNNNIWEQYGNIITEGVFLFDNIGFCNTIDLNSEGNMLIRRNEVAVYSDTNIEILEIIDNVWTSNREINNLYNYRSNKFTTTKDFNTVITNSLVGSSFNYPTEGNGSNGFIEWNGARDPLYV